MFFFVSQEFTDDKRPTTTARANLPTALERSGDFSQTYADHERHDPADHRPAAPACQFPGNIIPRRSRHQTRSARRC